MKTAVVRLSEVQKGNGCMLSARFLDKCGTCKIVTRCPNRQAYDGRVIRNDYQLKMAKKELRQLKIERIRLTLALWYIRTIGRLIPLYAPILRILYRKEE